MAYRAKIDHDGVYWGVEEVAALAAGDLEVPADCDCKPGAYRLMPAVGDEPAYLEPIEPQNIKAVAGAPTLEQAFYALLTEGPDAPRVLAWGEAFKQTVDGGSS